MQNLNLNPKKSPNQQASSNAYGSKPISVAELNRRIKIALESDFQRLWVIGEVGNLTVHRSGHVYFTLKDDRAQVRCVHFNGAEAARKMQLQDGSQVELAGRLTAYEIRGEYQIAVAKMRPVGLGALQQQFEELKKKLQAEGLFARERKRPLPFLPRQIGVVTSSDGAAIRDFLQVANRRFPHVHVQIFGTTVQGKTTARGVRAGLAWFNAQQTCDVVVITRGGGSMEDLWGFNDEALARDVANSAIPVVSAIGHEVDFTICDFVADVRAPTPSAAAELVLPELQQLERQVQRLQTRLRSAVELSVSRLRNRLQRASLHPVFHEPAALVRRYQQQVDELAMRNERSLEQQLELRRRRFERATERLRLLNPKQVLGRGYSILLDNDGAAVTEAATLKAGDSLTAILDKGQLHLNVTESSTNGNDHE